MPERGSEWVWGKCSQRCDEFTQGSIFPTDMEGADTKRRVDSCVKRVRTMCKAAVHRPLEEYYLRKGSFDGIRSL